MISKEYSPYAYGGAGVHVNYLTKELSKLMEVEVRCFGDQDLENPSLKVKGYKQWARMSDYKEKRFTEVLQALTCDLSIVRDPIDSDSIVHTHTWYTSFAGFLAKILYKVPLVVTCHSLEPLRPWKEEHLGTGYNLTSYFEKIAIENADLIIAVSAAMKDDIQKYFNISSEKIAVVHNGIDLNHWTPRSGDRIRQEFHIEGDYVLFVGRTSKQKGIVSLIDAIHRLERKDIKIVLRSGDADSEEIKHEVEAKVKGNDNIIWIERSLDEEEMIDLYSGAELTVCPSVYEPFGMVNIEAMACEKAVVASNVGGIKEVVVHEETGLLVPPSDPLALAKAINKLLGDKDLTKRLGKAGRKRVEQYFSWNRIAQKTKELYDGLLTN